MTALRKIGLLSTALVASLQLMPRPANAQTRDLAARQATGLERIAGVLDNWQTKFRRDGQRNGWTDVRPPAAAGETSFSRMDHGQAPRLTFILPEYKVDGFLSYNVWNDRYMLASIYDQIGQIDLQQGQFAGDRLILDKLKTDTTYQVRSSPTDTRLELHFAAARIVE